MDPLPQPTPSASKPFALIAAVGKGGIIGQNGRLPWHLPRELALFRGLTAGQVVLMGRRTFESVGCRPLPERSNVIISGTSSVKAQNFLWVYPSLEAFLTALPQQPAWEGKTLWICGGAALYAAALPLAHSLYLSRIQIPCTGDTYFPNFEPWFSNPPVVAWSDPDFITEVYRSDS